MTLHLETRFASEKFALKLRSLLAVAAILLVADKFSEALVLGSTAVLVGSILISFLFLRDESRFESKQRQVQALRWIDAVVVVGWGFFPAVASLSSWWLAIPMLIVEALISKNRATSFAFGCVLAVEAATAAILRNSSFYNVAICTATIFFSACLGVILNYFQQRDEILKKRDRRLESVLSCGGALADNGDLQQMMLHSLRTAIEETKAVCGYIMLFDDEESDILLSEVAYSLDGDFEFPEELTMEDGLSGYAAKMGQPITVSGTLDSERFDGIVPGVRSAACVPLISRGYRRAGQSSPEQTLGVLTLLDTTDDKAFQDDDMELLRTLSSLMAVAISNARMEEKRRATFLRTLESLATALEARDEYTRGHSQRVCELSLLIGERMGCSSDALEELRIGTILHDIGKIGVPDAILNKRARLTDEEFATMKSHPVIGYEICRPLMLSEGVLMIIRNHHEKLDGSGYPDGLKGGELPLSLRIVCVADAFDAMSSMRPYRAVMEIATVLAELSKGAGTQFDPVVVENLKELLHNGKLNELYSSYWDVSEEPKAA